MRSLSSHLQQELQDRFGPRVAFDRLERTFYSHDVGSLPSLVKPLVGNTLPAGVVQPLSEEQVVQLVAFSRTHGIPLVPRGKSTSGYGGVLPVKGGLVVDFAWMNQVLTVDAAALTVTVQPGVVWARVAWVLARTSTVRFAAASCRVTRCNPVARCASSAATSWT
jgi:FAD/FMN-containing dehydrogenase